MLSLVFFNDRLRSSRSLKRAAKWFSSIRWFVARSRSLPSKSFLVIINLSYTAKEPIIILRAAPSIIAAFALHLRIKTTKSIPRASIALVHSSDMVWALLNAPHDSLHPTEVLSIRILLVRTITEFRVSVHRERISPVVISAEWLGRNWAYHWLRRWLLDLRWFFVILEVHT